MDRYQGTCTSCNHSFRVTMSLPAEKVKCPQCGAAVEIAAYPSDVPASDPPSRPARGSVAARQEPGSPAPGGKAGARLAGERVKGGSSAAAARSRRGAAGKESPMPLLLGSVGAVLVAFAVWFFGFRGSGETTAAQAAESLPSIDLSQLADQQPLEGTTQAEWEAMNELMRRYITPPFGPSSVQYGDRLMIKGKRSVPAILNGFKRVDLTTAEGTEIGWRIQTLLLQGLCNDTNFGWRRETRPQDVTFNKRIIQRWFEAWELAKEDDQVWAEIAKQKDIPADLTQPGAARSQ